MIKATKRVFNTLLVTAIIIIFIVFSAVNRGVVHLSFFPFPYSAEVPEFLFAILCFAIGLIVGWIAIGMKLSQSKRLLKHEHNRVMLLQSELSGLKTKKHGLPTVISKK